MKPSELKRFVLIGASTGGPGQIEKIINTLDLLNETTIILAQHMVNDFIPSFAKRLQINSKNPVSMAEDGLIVENGHIYLCSGHTQISKNFNELRFTCKSSLVNTFNPDINIIFSSFIPLIKDYLILSVILTGIGDDGVNAVKELSDSGAKCLTESEKSAIVDGMPSRARKEVPNIEVLELDEIVQKIKEFSH